MNEVTMSNQFQRSQMKGTKKWAAMLTSSSVENSDAKTMSMMANMSSKPLICDWYSCHAGYGWFVY